MSARAIDLFAGAGGFSTGATQAGAQVVWAANHWAAAVDVHRANHPRTAHTCQDLHQANWHDVPSHDIGLASPACQGHSRARGVDRPHHDACRSTAWAIVSCAEVHRQSVWVVENVPEFLDWVLFPAWSQAMQSLGYSLAPHIVDAADCGVPQHRRRVFIVATRSQKPLRLNLSRREHAPIEPHLDLISGGWSPVRTKCARTRERVREGRRQHGARFLVAYYGNERGGRALARPLGTVTTKDRYALIEGDQMRMLTADEYRRAMGFPADYQLPRSSTLAKHMLGNAVCPPVARDILTEILAVA
jgi:DNA (cytosine-5)-methyltransferase 1